MEAETVTLTLPKGKLIRLGDERYKTLRPVEVPADQLAPAKKQTTRMRPFGCRVCGPFGRATMEHKLHITGCVCDGRGTHEAFFLSWLDDAPEPTEPTPEGDE